jgi:V8-like Glu-specific endopeptidase
VNIGRIFSTLAKSGMHNPMIDLWEQPLAGQITPIASILPNTALRVNILAGGRCGRSGTHFGNSQGGETMAKYFLLEHRSAKVFSLGVALALGCMAATTANVAQAAVLVRGSVVVLTTPNTPGAQVDIVNALPLPLPQPASADAAAEAQSDLIKLLTNAATGGGPSGFHAGNTGTGGGDAPVDLGTRAAAGNGASPQDWGTSNYPFTTAQADLNGVATNKDYPYRAAGNLAFLISGQSYLCSASLIAPGIVVTAAHCVNNWGQKQFYSNWKFSPGYRDGKAPYGVITTVAEYVPTAYYNGTDGCAQAGVICPDDVAILVLKPKGTAQAPVYIGSKVGWLGWNYGGGFVGGLTEITQLGYPCDLDACQLMERNDSQGFTSSLASRVGDIPTWQSSSRALRHSHPPASQSCIITPALHSRKLAKATLLKQRC